MKSSRAVHQTRNVFLSDDIEKSCPAAIRRLKRLRIVIWPRSHNRSCVFVNLAAWLGGCRVDAVARDEVTRRSRNLGAGPDCWRDPRFEPVRTGSLTHRSTVRLKRGDPKAAP
jgi:hypothetical protein